MLHGSLTVDVGGTTDQVITTIGLLHFSNKSKLYPFSCPSLL